MFTALSMNAIDTWSPRNVLRERAPVVQPRQIIPMLMEALIPFPEARQAVVRALCGDDGLPEVPL
jgi:hypothetical protein